MALGVVVVLAAGCGTDDDDGAAGDDTSTTQTTSKDDTTSTTAGSTTTPDDYPAETTSPAGLPDEPPFRDDAASGSGCTPGGDDLPDGWWYGSLESPPGDDLTVDLACYYSGAAAEAEAASRGDEVNNDYYVVNDNPQLRTLPVADGATASCVDLATIPQGFDCAPEDAAGDWAVWLRVHDGAVDRIVEQYAP